MPCYYVLLLLPNMSRWGLHDTEGNCYVIPTGILNRASSRSTKSKTASRGASPARRESNLFQAGLQVYSLDDSV